MLTAFVTSATLAAVALLTTSGQNTYDWLDYINRGGVVAMFIIIAYALLSKRIVMGWTYNDMVAERDYYRSLALKTTDLADRQVGAVEKLLEKSEAFDALTLRAEAWAARHRREDPDDK